MDFSYFPGEVRFGDTVFTWVLPKSRTWKKKDLEEGSLFERGSQEQGWGTRGNDREGGDALLRLVGHCCRQPGLDSVGTYKRPLRDLCLPHIGWQLPGNVNFLYFQAAHVGYRLNGVFPPSHATALRKPWGQKQKHNWGKVQSGPGKLKLAQDRPPQP